MNTLVAHMKYGGVLLVLVVGSSLLFVWPNLARESRLAESIAQRQERAAKEADNLVALERAKMRFESLKDRAAREMREIPAEGNAPWLHKSISEDMEELPLQLINLTWGAQETPVGSKMSLGVNIETVGEFAALYELVKRIEEMPRLVRLNELTLTRVSNGDGALVKADVRLKAFHRGSRAVATKSAGG